jgi:hypothetical protein
MHLRWFSGHPAESETSIPTGIPNFVSTIIKSGLGCKSTTRYSFKDIFDSPERTTSQLKMMLTQRRFQGLSAGLNQQNIQKTKRNHHISSIMIIEWDSIWVLYPMSRTHSIRFPWSGAEHPKDCMQLRHL